MIQYVKGDATRPIGDGRKIIVHCCNDIGAWGAGFVLALSKRWPHVRDNYLALESYDLGDVQFVRANQDITVANIIGQRGISDGGYRNPKPIRYEAIGQGLRVVYYYATLGPQAGASIHMPRIGCGLAGGVWEEMEPVIASALRDLSVTVYDF